MRLSVETSPRGSFTLSTSPPKMLQHFRDTLETLNIAMVDARQANVLNMDALPAAWANYDLIVTASMLEYVPRERLSDALAALRTRLADSGRLVVFITKRNWLTRPLIACGGGLTLQQE